MSEGHHHLAKDTPLWTSLRRGINVCWRKPPKTSGLSVIAASITPTNYNLLKSVIFSWVNGTLEKRAWSQACMSIIYPRGMFSG